MTPLSAKMPASEPASQEARMPAMRESDAPAFSGEGGAMDAPQSQMSQRNSGGVSCETSNVGNKEDWMNPDKKTGPMWELTDRKVGANGYA